MKFDEQIIKEKRVIEATKKDYLGSNGKFAVISKTLGDQIIDQGSLSNNFITYDNFWNQIEDSENKISYLDENINLSSMGYYFYGLNYSYNIEIFYFEDQKRIDVKYNGDAVYREAGGDLEMYIPSQEWESKIEALYKIAKPIEESNKKAEKKIMKEAFENKKNYILSYLKSKWGI